MTVNREQRKTFMTHYFLGGVVCLILFVVLFFGGCERAKAVEFQTPDDIYNYYQLYTNDNFYNIVEQISSDCSYWSIWYDSISGEAGIVFTPNTNFNGFFWTANSNFINDFNYSNQPFVQNNDHYSNFMASMYTLYGGDMDFVSYGNYVQYWNTYIYSLHFKNGYIDIYRFWADRSDWHGWQTMSYSAGYYCVANVNRHREFYNISNATWNGYTSGHYLDSFRYDYSYSNYDGCIGFSRSSDRYGRQIIQNYTPPAQTEGLKVYKQSIHNQNFLYVDFSDLVSVGAHSSNESDVSIAINIDDTESTFTFDDTSSYYHRDVSSAKIYYQIPFSALSLTGNIDYAYVTNVTVNSTVYFQGGGSESETFYYLDRVNLIGRAPAENITPPETLPTVDNITGYDSETITNIYELISLANSGTFAPDPDYNLTGGLTQRVPISQWGDDVSSSVIHLYHFRSTTGFAAGTVELGRYYLKFDPSQTSIGDIYTNHVSPWDMVRENNFSGYYDVLELVVHEQDWSGSTGNLSYTDEIRYYYFVSYRYQEKLILLREMDILNYIKYGNDIMSNVYDLEKERLNYISNTLYAYTKEALPELVKIYDVLNNIDGVLPDLKDILNRILDALLNLQLEQLDAIDTKLSTIITAIGNQSGEGGNADLTPVLNRLDTLINFNLANGSTQSPGYLRFVNWLREVDSSGNALPDTPVKYVSDTFDIFTTLFKSFPYSSDPDGNGVGFSDYAHSVRGLIGITSNDVSNVPSDFRDIANFYYYSITDDNYLPGAWYGR